MVKNIRYGAFLRSIPLQRRVGDYAHCAARVVNATLKRLTNQSFMVCQDVMVRYWYEFNYRRLHMIICVP